MQGLDIRLHEGHDEPVRPTPRLGLIESGIHDICGASCL